MRTETIQTRVSPVLKQDAEALFADIGLNLSDAIRLFLQQSVNRGGIPFEPRGKTPNAETIAAMEGLERGEGELYTDLDSLFASWQDD